MMPRDVLDESINQQSEKRHEGKFRVATNNFAVCFVIAWGND
jgi:hypothetical protein